VEPQYSYRRQLCDGLLHLFRASDRQHEPEQQRCFDDQTPSPAAPALPQITSLSDSPDPVSRNGNLTLTATASPGATSVSFYRDNGNGVFGTGDVLLGTDSNGGDGFSLISKISINPGTYTYFAQGKTPAARSATSLSTTNTVKKQGGKTVQTIHIPMPQVPKATRARKATRSACSSRWATPARCTPTRACSPINRSRTRWRERCSGGARRGLIDAAAPETSIACARCSTPAPIPVARPAMWATKPTLVRSPTAAERGHLAVTQLLTRARRRPQPPRGQRRVP
jgi:hypothetical protein